MTGLADKVAVVTGGAGGIGSAVGARLAADGHHVVIVYHTAGEAAFLASDAGRWITGQVITVDGGAT
jgi:NAD(P)-dependent dehydrogenase (short-subunit alcohol dehydrogenase family)